MPGKGRSYYQGASNGNVSSAKGKAPKKTGAQPIANKTSGSSGTRKLANRASIPVSSTQTFPTKGRPPQISPALRNSTRRSK